jgi:hypothetical protein
MLNDKANKLVSLCSQTLQELWITPWCTCEAGGIKWFNSATRQFVRWTGQLAYYHARNQGWRKAYYQLSELHKEAQQRLKKLQEEKAK